MKPLKDEPKLRKPVTAARSAAHESPSRIGAGAGSKKGGARSAAPKLELFQKEDCPFSHAVRRKLSELGLDFVAHTVPEGNPLKHEQLVQAGGKDQIPFLIDHRRGVKLYESSAILAYLDAEYGRARFQGRVLRYADRLSSVVRSRADVIAWTVRKPVDAYEDARGDLFAVGDSLLKAFRLVRDTVRSEVSSRLAERRRGGART